MGDVWYGADVDQPRRFYLHSRFYRWLGNDNINYR